MIIFPKLTIAAVALIPLAIGLAGGAFIDHRIMQGRIDKITIAHTEELRVREVERADDERAARTREQLLASQIGLIEQEKQNAITTANTSANALIERLRKQAASKPANPSGMPQAAPACETTAGRELYNRSREDTVRLAERAEKYRLGLGACYESYDLIGR